MRIANLTALVALAIATPALAEPEWKAVGQALGKEGSVMPGGVYRVGLPRTDLRSRSTASRSSPASRSAPGSPSSRCMTGAMVMGDLVLTGEEVNPVMKKLLESGIEITALHNHLLRSEPATMYMHVAGQGMRSSSRPRCTRASH